MKRVPIKLGPLALLLAVISICLTMLALLTCSTARADRRLAEKFAQTVSTPSPAGSATPKDAAGPCWSATARACGSASPRTGTTGAL